MRLRDGSNTAETFRPLRRSSFPGLPFRSRPSSDVMPGQEQCPRGVKTAGNTCPGNGRLINTAPRVGWTLVPCNPGGSAHIRPTQRTWCGFEAAGVTARLRCERARTDGLRLVHSRAHLTIRALSTGSGSAQARSWRGGEAHASCPFAPEPGLFRVRSFLTAETLVLDQSFAVLQQLSP